MTNAFPVRLAAIDIGSNAIRMLAAEFPAALRLVPLAERRLAVRLGHDVFLTGALSEATANAAVAGLADFARRIRKLDVAAVRVVATSAVRDSMNGRALVERARLEADLRIEVISGAEEARLVHLAVRNRVNLRDQQWLLADLGGGSVEISVVDHHAVHRTETYPVGSVRMLERLGPNASLPQLTRAVTEYTAPLADSTLLKSEVAGFIATCGNIEALARISNAAPDASGALRISIEVLRDLITRLGQVSYLERIRRFHLRADRADVILPAALVYERLAAHAGASTILVPAVGVKEGVLWDLLDRPRPS